MVSKPSNILVSKQHYYNEEHGSQLNEISMEQPIVWQLDDLGEARSELAKTTMITGGTHP